jgi:hypothetical protein
MTNKFVDLQYKEFLKIPFFNFRLCNILEVLVGLYRPYHEHEYKEDQAKVIYEVVKNNQNKIEIIKHFIKFGW